MILGFPVADAAGFGHEIDENLIGNTNHRELRHITRIQFPHGAIRKRGQGSKHLRFISRRWINEQVDIHRGTRITGLPDGKAPDNDIPGPASVQLTADMDNVFDGGFAGD